MKGFCGSSHHWAHNHTNVYCVVTVHHRNMEVSVSLNTSSFVLKNCCWMNFKVFVEATIYEPIITLMPFAWRCHQNKKILICLNADWFCLFNKLLLIWISRFLWKQSIWAYYHVDGSCVMTSSGQGNFCLFQWWLPLFIWQTFLTWISRFLQNQLCHLWIYNHVEAYCVLTSLD